MLQVATEYCGGEVDEETKLNAGIGDMLLTGEVSHYSCYILLLVLNFLFL